MAPVDRSLFTVSDNTPAYNELLSLHEAGHAVVGTVVGIRIEAVYSTFEHLPNGNVRLYPHCRTAPKSSTEVSFKDKVLLMAGGAAAELSVNNAWDSDNTKIDRVQLQDIGIWNFEYCVGVALDAVRANKVFLVALRERIKFSMENLKQCKVTRGGSHIILAAGSLIDKLGGKLGCPIDSESLDLEVARRRE
jgi:hypothetical protein